MIGRLRTTLVAAAATAGLLAAAPSASAALQWNDGQVATSTFTCVGQIVQGADVIAGYQADPSSLPRAGDVFYAHVGFGAAIPPCGGGTQYAEVDLVLPPGVSMAVDAGHPITCTYTDINGPTVPNPTCPTNTNDRGVYGLGLSPNGPGSAWQLPPGRWFEIQFPLRSDRRLQGEAGGYCPQTVQETLRSLQNDCLGVAFGLSDGAGNPWLLAHEGLVIDPAAPSPQPQPGATPPIPIPTPKPPAVVTRIAFAHAHLATLTKQRLTLSLRCAKRCRGKVTITIPTQTARRLHLSRHALTLARGRFSGRPGKAATLHLKVSHTLATRLRRTPSLAVTVTATPSGGAKTVAHLSLRR